MTRVCVRQPRGVHWPAGSRCAAPHMWHRLLSASRSERKWTIWSRCRCVIGCGDVGTDFRGGWESGEVGRARDGEQANGWVISLWSLAAAAPLTCQESVRRRVMRRWGRGGHPASAAALIDWTGPCATNNNAHSQSGACNKLDAATRETCLKYLFISCKKKLIIIAGAPWCNN